MVRHAALRGLYEVEKTIGCGGFAKVKLATHLATGEKVAIKIMEKAGLGDDLPRIKLELKALKTLSHQHICKLYQVIETETHFFIVIEYCSGGELFDHIVEKNRLTEAESRMFFRQIVSAVAYLHSLGYAHRDLKPENVLLDKDQNLKLIDFGLCARPEGGIENPLFTSCGSPTYAAPELVLGKQYLGPEVDVWAMGVLLYALLAGSLPFDDLSIDSLYKKILSGKYAEPSYMSPESKRLIRSMLQVNPKNRITVTELLSHPWLTLGILDPVDFAPEDWKKFDGDCVAALAKYYEVSDDVAWRYVSKWKYDYHTATYLLLLARKRRGSSVRLQSVSLNARLRAVLRQGTPNHPNVARLKLQELPLTTIRQPNHQQPAPNSNSGESNHSRNNANHTANFAVAMAAVNNTPYKRTPQHVTMDSPRNVKNSATTSTPMTPRSDEGFENDNSPLRARVAAGGAGKRRFLEPQKPSSSVSAGADPGVTVTRKPQKRMWSPTFDDEPSPVPNKKLTIRKSTPKTPERKKLNSASDTPGSARRVLGSIERSLHKVRHVLTPRRTPSKDTSQPVVLSNKDLCNVSTTQCSDPEFVITELSRALQRKGFQCNRKGFLLRGKVEANVLHHCSGCSFELEVCYLPHMGPNLAKLSSQNHETPTKSILKNGVLNFDTPTNEKTSIPTPGASWSLKNNENSWSRSNTNKQSDWIDRPFAFVGIKRKRLKGDSWCYKKVCEEVLAVTVKDLRPMMTESAV